MVIFETRGSAVFFRSTTLWWQGAARKIFENIWQERFSRNTEEGRSPKFTVTIEPRGISQRFGTLKVEVRKGRVKKPIFEKEVFVERQHRRSTIIRSEPDHRLIRESELARYLFGPYYDLFYKEQ